MRVIDYTKFPVKIWASGIEWEAENQLCNTANLPFIYKWVAAMPDCHAGKGATVGSVIATRDSIIPAAVGVDIGCGMTAVRLLLKTKDLGDTESLTVLKDSIEGAIPLGMTRNKALTRTAKAEFDALGDLKNLQIDDNELQDAALKIGSLGSGNHFIEVCKDTDDNVWVMLHSGSRHIGNVVAQKYMKDAEKLMAKFHIGLPDKNLAYLPRGTEEFENYFAALQWCQRYAKANRKEMLQRVISILSNHVYGHEKLKKYLYDFEIDCHHNYSAIEHHFGENVIVTRKGAISAKAGEWGIIPGSMGTKSYIVKGLGNPESFMSCSHGAGRVMSRKKAKEKFNVDDAANQTAGVICRKDAGILDELPGAYKDIDEVMENQKDLVEPIYQLKQIICIKG